MTLDRQKKILILSEVDESSLNNRIQYRVFFRDVPVASFYEKDIPSKKIAAIHLVESKLASIEEAVKIVGLHRNTISKAIQTKRKFGIRCAIQDNRGPKNPYHYTPERKAYIINLLKKFPELIDEEIAKRAAKGLKTRVTRQAVARIRLTVKNERENVKKKKKSMSCSQTTPKTSVKAEKRKGEISKRKGKKYTFS